MTRPDRNAMQAAVCAMKALALAGAIVACSVSGAQTPAARDAIRPAVKPVAVTAAETTQGAKVRITRRSATYWRVTLDNPPLNLIGPNEVR